MVKKKSRLLKQHNIGSRNTKKYHTEDCQYVKTISDKNKVYFSSSQEAQNEGYIPCKACNP